MRQFVAILLSLSLSWVTTGYACEYATVHATQRVCCCHPGQATHCPSPKHCQADVSKPGKACCDVVSLSGIKADEGATTDSKSSPNFQPLAPPPALPDHSLSQNPPRPALRIARADDDLYGWGTQTYLQTARLRI